jgi:hypothetical protein
MALQDSATIIAVGLAVIIACVIVIYAMRNRRKQPENSVETKTKLESTGLPFKVVKSVQTSDATNAKDELRILDLEREILSSALRRLYEAHAEGKISEQERERLAGSYKTRMNAVKESMTKDENIVALHELEGMQEDLMKLFSERFGDLSEKVEELRSKIQVQPVKEITVRMPKTPIFEEAETEEEEKRKPRKKRKPTEKPNLKSEAEKRIEEIRSEVEKVLDKLGQMEIES